MPSVSERVLDAVVAQIGLLPLVPAQTVRRRKRLVLADGESPPLILAAQGDGRDFEQVAKGWWLVRYPVSVAAAFPKGGKLEDNTTLRDWADAVTFALLDWRNLADRGLTECNGCTPHDKTLFDPAGRSADLDWWAADFLVETLEKRY